MQATSPFEVLRRVKTLNWSGLFTSAYLSGTQGNGTQVPGTLTAPRGLALGAHASDGEQVALAGPNSYIGHLTRNVVVGGLQLADRVFGVTSATPVGLESPFVDGLEVTLEKVQTVEAEGPTYILTSGTGAIDNTTAVGAKLSFNAGRYSVAQSGETAFSLLAANNLTPSDGSSLRIRAEFIA